MVNLQELLDPLDVFRKITGRRLEDVYNLMLKKGWTLGSPQLTWRDAPGDRALPRKAGAAAREVLAAKAVPTWWSRWCRISTAPCARAWETRCPDTFGNDPDGYRRLPAALLDRAAGTVLGMRIANGPCEQARAIGHPDEHIFRTSGMILNPRFYDPPDPRPRGRTPAPGPRCRPAYRPGDVRRRRLARECADIARHLDRSDLKLQLILICGRNDALAERLRGMPHRIPMFVEGFTKEVPYYMRCRISSSASPGREHQRGLGNAPARHRAAQRLDAAPGTLQHAMDRRKRRRASC